MLKLLISQQKGYLRKVYLGCCFSTSVMKGFFIRVLRGGKFPRKKILVGEEVSTSDRFLLILELLLVAWKLK